MGGDQFFYWVGWVDYLGGGAQKKKTPDFRSPEDVISEVSFQREQHNVTQKPSLQSRATDPRTKAQLKVQLA